MIKSLCRWFRISTPPTVQEAVLKLKEVCKMQQELIDKYETEIQIVKRQCKAAIQTKASKQSKLYYIKKIKIIQHHQESTRKRLLACTEKQYHLEGLNITSMHLEAVKSATNTLKHFMKETDVDKVDELASNMSELIADACEIQNIMTQDVNANQDWTDEDLENDLAALENDDELWPEIPLGGEDPKDDTDVNDIDVSTPLVKKTIHKKQEYQRLSVASYV